MTLKPSFFPLLVLVFFVTNLVHESCHWLMGTALGLEMDFGLNAVRYLSPTAPWQRALTSAAGPAVTILQALIAYALLVRSAAPAAFAFLYAATFMRLVAGLVSFMLPNDEARVSIFLGLGKWTLPVLVAGALLVLTARGSQRLRLGWKDQLACYALASLAIAFIVWLDRVLR